MSQYFPKPFRSFGGNINAKVDLSNYATRTDLKKCDTRWYFKLLAVPVDLSKLSDVVKKWCC